MGRGEAFWGNDKKLAARGFVKYIGGVGITF